MCSLPKFVETARINSRLDQFSLVASNRDFTIIDYPDLISQYFWARIIGLCLEPVASFLARRDVSIDGPQAS